MDAPEVLVGAKDLGVAINPIEAQLASHVSERPRLNFLVYVPTEEQVRILICITFNYFFGTCKSSFL